MCGFLRGPVSVLDDGRQREVSLDISNDPCSRCGCGLDDHPRITEDIWVRYSHRNTRHPHEYTGNKMGSLLHGHGFLDHIELGGTRLRFASLGCSTQPMPHKHEILEGITVNEQKIVDCSECGHLEWRDRIERGECRFCLLFSGEKARTI